MGPRGIICLLVVVVFSWVGLEGISIAQANIIDLYNFDFSRKRSPVQTGWVQVTNTTRYLPQLGYGWDANLHGTNRSRATPPEYQNMLQDFNNSGGDRTFKIDLSAGTYSIELYFYDITDHSNNWTVYLGDRSDVLATLTALPGYTEVIRKFDITMESAGQLDLRFHKTGKGNWQINGIKVAQEVPAPPTMLLMGTGLMGLRLIGRARRKFYTGTESHGSR